MKDNASGGGRTEIEVVDHGRETGTTEKSHCVSYFSGGEVFRNAATRKEVSFASSVETIGSGFEKLNETVGEEEKTRRTRST